MRPKLAPPSPISCNLPYKTRLWFILPLLFVVSTVWGQTIPGVSITPPQRGLLPVVTSPLATTIKPNTIGFPFSSAPTVNLPAPGILLPPTLPTVNAFPDHFQQGGNSGDVLQMASIERDLMETDFYRKHIKWLEQSKYYRKAFEQLSGMDPDSFSLANAVYLVENAYMDNQIPYIAFVQNIQQKADHVKQIIKRKGLNMKNNTVLNYGIQKLYSQQTPYYNAATKQTFLIKPLSYRFEDFQGEKDYTNMFVTKLLVTSKGQCHSLPLLYLLIAEQLGAKASLSLAPQHSFIKFQDSHGRLYNFECTNGSIVSNTWITQSGYITAKSLQNHTYFDTLSQRQLYAQMVTDLMLGYLKKFPYDDFAEVMRQKVLATNPGNVQALIVGANVQTRVAMAKIKSVGNPQPDALSQYPEAYKAYLTMQSCYEQVDATGYQDMPAEAYQKWLQSIQQEKKKQATTEAQQRLEREIHELKKGTFKSSPIH